MGDAASLCVGLCSERENVRRATAYGLASLRGADAEAAAPAVVELCGSANKSTRKCVAIQIQLAVGSWPS